VKISFGAILCFRVLVAYFYIFLFFKITNLIILILLIFYLCFLNLQIMRKTIFFLAFAALIALLISCKPSKEEAKKYNDALVNEEVLVIEAESAFTDAVVNNKQEELDKLYDAFVSQIDASTTLISAMKPLGGDTKFKDATLALLTAYKSVAKNEYAEVLKIAKLPDEEFTEELNNKLNDLSIAIDEKLNKEVQNFLNAQKELAGKYDITLASTKKTN
jgi:hypothetical protein